MELKNHSSILYPLEGIKGLQERGYNMESIVKEITFAFKDELGKDFSI